MKRVIYQGKKFLYDETKGVLIVATDDWSPTDETIQDFDASQLEPVDTGQGGSSGQGDSNGTQKMYPERIVKGLREEAKKYREELERFRELLGSRSAEDLKKLLEEEEERQRKAERERLEQLKREGKLQQLLDEQKAEFERQKRELLKQIEEANQRLANFRTTSELMKYASRPDSVKPEQVVNLLRPYIKLDGDELVVLDEDGKTRRLNAHGEPMTVKEFVDEFYKENPWFLRGRAGGAGSGSDGTGDKIPPNPWKRETYNLTMQGTLLRDNPELAKRMIKEAGRDPAQYGLF